MTCAVGYFAVHINPHLSFLLSLVPRPQPCFPLLFWVQTVFQVTDLSLYVADLHGTGTVQLVT